MTTARRFVTPIAGLAAIVLFLLYDPWIVPPNGARPALTVVFWVAAVVLLVLLFQDRNHPQAQDVEVEGPAFTRYLFGNTRAGLFWLPIRIFVGFEWLLAGWGKLSGTGWTDGGASLLGFWKSAVAIPQTGKPSITFEWYRSFLQILIDNKAQGWFAWLITLGEMAVGIGILVGALVGIAAFFGATMNMSYMLAGSASTNPILFALTVGLMLAWRVAGYYGLDRYLLPLLGVPWKRRAGAAGKPGQGAPAAT
ncbi:MAG: DoxX family protein [Candidatus Limnocylindrales bacterium]|jgi:thiosulfate dehydrogenase [quinone] large subunit